MPTTTSRPRRPRRIVPAAALLAVLALAGCSDADTSTTGDAPGTSAPATTSGASTTGATTPATSSPTTTTAAPADCTTTGTDARRDQRYATTPGVDADLQSLDLYLPVRPAGCGPVPVLVHVHGGAFSVGDKANRIGDKVRWANEQGWALAAVNYRLSPRPAAPDDPGRVRYPDHNEDLADALGWLHDRSEQLGIDAGRMALMGHSAGAYLVALHATDPTFGDVAGVGRSDVRCTVPLDTSQYDITAAAPGSRAEQVMYRNAFGDDPRVRAAASPALQAAPGEGTGPFLVVTRLPRGRDRGARDFVAALGAAGIPAEVLNTPGLSHAEVNHSVGRPGDTVVTPRLTAFLDGCLGT